MRTLAALLVTLAALLLGAAQAFAGPGSYSTADTAGDGNPDLLGVGAVWNEDGWIGFTATIHRSYLFTGEDIGVLIDTTWPGPWEYRLMLHQYGDGQGVRLMSRTPDDTGWNFDTPNNTTGGRFQDGQMDLWVHRSELGWPTNPIGVGHFTNGGQYAAVYDQSPDDGSGWILPAPSEVGGASGPGVQDSPPPPPPPPPAAAPAPAPAMSAPATRARVSAAKARTAIRNLLKRRLPSRARIRLRGCQTRSNRTVLVCRVTARRKSGRWSGTATARVLPSGRHTAKFSGRSWRTACRSCGRRVRWP